MKTAITLVAGMLLAGATLLAAPIGEPPLGTNASGDQPGEEKAAEQKAVAIFAGGCFWCVEADFDKLTGVIETVSGYTGGALDNPTYRDVITETTGHYEAVRITYDPSTVSYDALVSYLLRHVDPLDANGQFCDRGPSYRTAIFPATPDERAAAQAAIADASALLNAQVVTDVIDQGTFWPAEDYHQDYYLKNPVQYRYYRTVCGRDRRIEAVWGDVDTAKPA